MSRWDELETLVGRVESWDAESRARVVEAGVRLADLCTRAHVHAHTSEFELDRFGEDERVYGYLAVGPEGLYLAVRTTEDDFEAFLSWEDSGQVGPYPEPTFTVKDPPSWSLQWLRAVVAQDKLGELVGCVEAELTTLLNSDPAHATSVSEGSLLHEHRLPAPPVATAAGGLSWGRVVDQWRRLERERLTDPSSALTAAGTLVEVVCKHILKEAGVELGDASGVVQVHKKAAAHLGQLPGPTLPPRVRALAQGLTSVVQGVAELRNAHGDAHAPDADGPSLDARYVELAVGAAGLVSTFLMREAEIRRSGNG